MKRIAVIAVIAVGAVGGLAVGLVACKRPEGAKETALALVDGARTGGIERGLIDEELIERIRRAERLQQAAHARVAPDVLAKIWASELDRGLNGEEKSRQLRERAGAGIRRSLHGRCEGMEDAAGAKRRVEAIVTPVDGATAEVGEELAKLGREIAGARLIKVSCDDGAVGVMVVAGAGAGAGAGGFRVVDVFPLGGLHMPLPGQQGK